MNIYFSSTHLQTLCDLKALAEKHGCSITFGVNDFDDFTGYEKFTDYSENIIEELRDRGFFGLIQKKVLRRVFGLNYSTQITKNAIIII